MKQALSRVEATTLVVVASVAFSIAGPAARWARPTPPLAVAFGRVALAAILLAIFGARSAFVSWSATAPRSRALVVLAGALLGAHFALFIVGLDRTSLPAAISLVAIEPVSVVLAAWLFHRVRPTPREAVGVGVASLGGLVVASGAGRGDHRLAGDLMVLGAVAVYGTYVAIARGVNDALPARSYATIVYAIAALTLLPMMLVFEGIPRVDAHAMIAITALALLPTLVGHTLVQVGARVLSPSTVALVSPGETLGGLVIGAIAFGARPSIVEGVGAVVILVGAGVVIGGQAEGATAVSVPSSPT